MQTIFVEDLVSNQIKELAQAHVDKLFKDGKQINIFHYRAYIHGYMDASRHFLDLINSTASAPVKAGGDTA